jgi:hypothetical protein
VVRACAGRQEVEVALDPYVRTRPACASNRLLLSACVGGGAGPRVGRNRQAQGDDLTTTHGRQSARGSLILNLENVTFGIRTGLKNRLNLMK